MSQSKYLIHVNWGDETFEVDKHRLSIRDNFVHAKAAKTKDNGQVSVMIPLSAVRLIEEIMPTSKPEDVSKEPTNIRMWKFSQKKPED